MDFDWKKWMADCGLGPVRAAEALGCTYTTFHAFVTGRQTARPIYVWLAGMVAKHGTVYPAPMSADGLTAWATAHGLMTLKQGSDALMVSLSAYNSWRVGKIRVPRSACLTIAYLEKEGFTGPQREEVGPVVFCDKKGRPTHKVEKFPGGGCRLWVMGKGGSWEPVPVTDKAGQAWLAKHGF